MFEIEPKDVREGPQMFLRKRFQRKGTTEALKWSKSGVWRRPVCLQQWVRGRGEELGQRGHEGGGQMIQGPAGHCEG